MKKCLPKKLTWFAIVIWIFPLIVSAKETTNSQEESVFVVGGTQKELTPFPNDEGTRKIIKQTEIEHEARLLEKQGYFDKAIVKYQEAMDATLLNTERDKSGGMVGIMRIHQKQGELDLALQDLEEWRKLHVSQPPGQLYVDTKSELEALIKMRDTNSNEPIYAHIEHLKKKYKKQLPPTSIYFLFLTLSPVLLSVYMTTLEMPMRGLLLSMEFFRIKNYILENTPHILR